MPDDITTGDTRTGDGSAGDADYGVIGVDFAEALGQPADAELDTLLRWCARAREFPPTPDAEGLDPSDLAGVPGWLRGAYPELFAHEHLRERLNLYDMHMELALYAHHPEAEVRDLARDRIAELLLGRNHLEGVLRQSAAQGGDAPREGIGSARVRNRLR